MRFTIILGTLASLLSIFGCMQAPNTTNLVGDREKEIVISNLEGHSHPIRAKRATQASRAMARRNDLLKRMVKNLLERDENMETKDAFDIAKEALTTGTPALLRAEGVEGHENVLPYLHTNNDACNNIALTCNATFQFRNITGTCNNIQNPFWGSADIALRRYIDAEYPDGVSMPIGGFSSENNASLPSPRVVSTKFHADVNMPSAAATHMLTQMGQFLDHDITLTPEHEVDDCCHSPDQPECLPLYLPLDDPFYSSLSSSQTCLQFSRSVAFCEDPTKPRDQMNGITAYIDGSNVYGSDEETSNLLRSHKNGKLLINSDPAYADNPMLPIIDGVFQAGDIRAIVVPGLAAMHTLFLREHNRLAEAIQVASTHELDDEEIFQTARRILIAEMQNIVYSEYLPLVLGTKTMTDYELSLPSNIGSFSSYNKSSDPSIYNSFATAAYRFGHSMIQGLIKMMSTTTFQTADEYKLRDQYFNLESYLQNGGEGMEQLLAGLINQPSQDTDRFFTEEATNFLFPTAGHQFGSDLVARNIQRGRDHGLPGYNSWRKFCKLANIESMKERPIEISSNNWEVLRDLYNSPDDIDLFTGGLAETHMAGGLTGPTFNCIMAKQFESLKSGDRFFFTHGDQAGSFSSDQLTEIRGRKLRDIICENTAIVATRMNVFRLDGDLVDCAKVNHMDIKIFV